jgi:hypothetical protein
MAAALKNLSGYTWGLTTETFGISVKSFTQKAGSEIFAHKDHQGETVGKVFFDFSVSGSISGATTAAPDENIADAITLANQIAGLGGVTGGTTLIHSVEVSKENEKLMELTLEFERHPTLTII